MPRQPDEDHARPEGLTDASVSAAGKVSEAYEWVIRARGRLYDFHQMMGRADLTLGEGIEELRAAGHEDLADELQRTWVGRNALPDMWTFEIVERFDDTYYDVATAGAKRVRDEVNGGIRHVFESEMKADRRAEGPTEDV